MVRPPPGPPDQPPRTGPRRSPARAGPSGPGRCWSWPPRPPQRCGPAGSASRKRPASGGSPRCQESGPPCISTPPSPSRSASRRTRPMRCAPGWPARMRSARGRAGSRSGPRSARSCSGWPGRSPLTCWPTLGPHGHRGPSPPSCPACRSWSWPWGPHWPTCSAPMPAPRTGPGPPTIHRTTGPTDQPVPGPRDGPPRTRPQTLRNWSRLRTAPQGRRAGTAGTLLARSTAPAARTARNTYPKPDETRLIARRLAAAGTPVSRRTLRSNGATGSNAQLGALARTVNAELAAAAAGKRTGPPG